MPHRPINRRPCKGCPFRRIALPGWCGASAPEGFIASILKEEPLPCHLSIDYDDSSWRERWFDGEIGKMCRGALTLMANTAKLARDQDLIPAVDPDPKTVFATYREFLDHHNAAQVKSWDGIARRVHGDS